MAETYGDGTVRLTCPHQVLTVPLFCLLLPLQEFARVAETYGDGTVRLTCEENILFVNVPNQKLPEMLADQLFTKFKVNPGKPSC